MTCSWRVDRTWCRPGDGTWVAGGVPRRLWRLGAGGRRVADALERGEPPPPGHEPLTRRLVEAGALHPEPVAAAPLMRCDVVVPTLNGSPDALHRLVTQVQAELGSSASVVIVDDASDLPVQACDAVRVIRTAERGGPAQARNVGTAPGDAEVLLFVDDDIDLPPGWAAPLLGHLDDPTVVAVAPRIIGPAPDDARRWWQRSEQVRSPLDLGPQPAPVRAGGRVPYVPSAVLLVRRRAFEQAKGFDTDLRYGEDVDLVWRLYRAGGQVRYDPRVVVHHEARPTWRGWLTQRFAYGTSAAPLAVRHPDAIVAARLNTSQLVVWLAVLIGHPLAALAALATAGRSTLALRRVLTERGIADAGRWALRWSAAGLVASARQCASALWRPWWPLALLGALVSRRGRRVAVAATVVTIADDLVWWRRAPRLDPLRFVATARVGDLAYGAGVWRGAWQHRTWKPLRLSRGTPSKVGQP